MDTIIYILLWVLFTIVGLFFVSWGGDSAFGELNGVAIYKASFQDLVIESISLHWLLGFFVVGTILNSMREGK